ncbi:MAG: hydrogenase maturation protease [Elusimicrobia bacterium]|nr:hydrogenase maturation protease [Elusimicrobiota bacterium]
MQTTHRDPAEERTEAIDAAAADVLIIGCGNVLMGDDGFGPAFIKHLEQTGGLPEGVGLLDAGTGVRSFLFGLVLADQKPRRILIVDAVDMGRKPGEVFHIDLEAVPALKADDFSLHQLPTSNMLRELRDSCGVEVGVLAVQVESIPDRVDWGLSPPMIQALEPARAAVLAWLG